MAAFEPGKNGARERTGRIARERLDDPRMAALVLWQSARDGVGLLVVLAAIDVFECIDGGENECRSEAPREKAEDAAAHIGPQLRRHLAARADALAPEFRVRFFHSREPRIDLL